MNTACTVVVGLDWSDHGRAAAEYAATVADRRHLPLRLVQAFEPWQYDLRPSAIGWTPSIEDVSCNLSQRPLDETTEVLSVAYPDLEVSSRLQPGSAAETFIEESERAELLVLGSRGRGGLPTWSSVQRRFA